MAKRGYREFYNEIKRASSETFRLPLSGGGVSYRAVPTLMNEMGMNVKGTDDIKASNAALILSCFEEIAELREEVETLRALVTPDVS